MNDLLVKGIYGPPFWHYGILSSPLPFYLHVYPYIYHHFIRLYHLYILNIPRIFSPKISNPRINIYNIYIYISLLHLPPFNLVHGCNIHYDYILTNPPLSCYSQSFLYRSLQVLFHIKKCIPLWSAPTKLIF